MKNCFLLLLATGLAFGCASNKKHVSITNKTFKNNFAKISDKLYAGIGEVSNQQYNQFLQSLLAAGNKDAYEKNKVDSAGWRNTLAFNEPMVVFYHSHPVYKNYPVVNITYENALAYCKWLTDEYNKNPKRTYKKVVFRLPTEEEWKIAARGGKENMLFPWGGPYLRNSKGNYLANFTTVDESSAIDTTIGGKKRVLLKNTGQVGVSEQVLNNTLITVPAKAYYPNGFGLYNMAGNVSEMLAEKGKTKGGNWSSYGYYLRIDVEDEFEGLLLEPSAKVGFRVFAEVLEK